MTTNTDIDQLSYEAAAEQLESIIKKLDSGQSPLASFVASFERATLLKNHCEKLLNEAQLRIEEISKTQTGYAAKKIDL